MIKSLLVGLLSATTGCGSFITDVTDVLDAHKVEYRIVKEIPNHADAAGFFEFSTGIMYFDEDYIGLSGYNLQITAAHELIHKLRYDGGIMTDDPQLEEAIAVYGATQVAYLVGFGRVHYNKKQALIAALKANNLEEKTLNMDQVMAEIDKTIELVRQFNRNKE